MSQDMSKSLRWIAFRKKVYFIVLLYIEFQGVFFACSKLNYGKIIYNKLNLNIQLDKKIPFLLTSTSVATLKVNMTWNILDGVIIVVFKLIF